MSVSVHLSGSFIISLYTPVKAESLGPLMDPALY